MRRLEVNRMNPVTQCVLTVVAALFLGVFLVFPLIFNWDVEKMGTFIFAVETFFRAL